MGTTEWFEECSKSVVSKARELGVPMSRSEIELHLRPKVGWAEGRRLSADWYDGDRRYGFLLKWRLDSKWPTVDEIVAAAVPFLEEYATIEIGPRERFLPDDHTVWITPGD